MSPFCCFKITDRIHFTASRDQHPSKYTQLLHFDVSSEKPLGTTHVLRKSSNIWVYTIPHHQSNPHHIHT